MTVALDKSKGTCVGNDNRDFSYVVRLMLVHVSNFVKQTSFLVYFASFFLRMSSHKHGPQGETVEGFNPPT